MDQLLCESTNAINRPLLVCKVCCKTENIRRCSACQSVYYCSKECQTLDWQNHRPDCKRKMQENASKADSATNQEVETPQNPLGITQEELDCYLGDAAASNLNFDLMSDSGSLEIVENLLQQQLFDDSTTTTTTPNTDENGMVRDFGMLDDLLFSSTTDFDLASSASTTEGATATTSQFGIGSEMMPLTNNDIFPELNNMQFR